MSKEYKLDFTEFDPIYTYLDLTNKGPFNNYLIEEGVKKIPQILEGKKLQEYYEDLFDDFKEYQKEQDFILPDKTILEVFEEAKEALGKLVITKYSRKRNIDIELALEN